MFPADGPKSWLLCGCQSLETRGLDSVCKQSLIAKKRSCWCPCFFLAFMTVKRQSEHIEQWATPHHLSDVRRGAPSWIRVYLARSPVRRNWPSSSDCALFKRRDVRFLSFVIAERLS